MFNQAKHDAIVAANAALSGAGLPSYDDLVRQLTSAHAALLKNYSGGAESRDLISRLRDTLDSAAK